MTPASLNDNPRLSRYVVAIDGEGGGGLYNTVTRVLLPMDAAIDRLERELFLEGQEAASMERRLFAHRTLLTLTTMVTWECNLRCNHCTVLDRLTPKQNRDIDVDKLADFVLRFRDTRPEIDSLKITFLGGEPLLRPDLCLGILQRTRSLGLRSHYDATTNLAFEMRAAHLELISQLDDLVVSLDGLEPLHNAQRRPYKGDFNPFQATVENLRRLVNEGLGEKILVQGAIRDEFAKLENFQDYQRFLMTLGVRYDRIVFETIHPTSHRPRPQRSYLASLQVPKLRLDACCKYRGAYKLIVDHDDTLYSDYYDWERLGTLDGDVAGLLERHKEMVLSSMPALHDEGCRSCPVIGYCWGGCTNAGEFSRHPSLYCNRQGLIEKVRTLASDGSLPGLKTSGPDCG